MELTPKRVLQGMAGAAVLSLAVAAGAQAPATTTDSSATPAAAPAAAPAASPTWSAGPIDFSGYIDGYFTYNHNRPAGNANYNYNFNDLDQFNLEAAKVTLNHDADPVGAHIDLLFGRTNTLIQGNGLGVNYIEQAYLSVKPPKAKGFEFDFGQFATSAGQEVIETMNNWSYSHGILFTDAIPYYHFGIRTSMPVTKSWTAGVQVVNGWNNVTDNNGGVTIGLTSSLVKPKYTWNTNYYVGPENNGITPPSFAGTQNGYRNLIDTTLLLTPTAKFSWYINYDYTQNHTPAVPSFLVKETSRHVQGIATSARGQVSANSALVGRYEYFADQGPNYTINGAAALIGTGTRQKLQEFTATYEYKWPAGLLMRAEYRYDWSNQKVFNYGNDNSVSPFGPSKTNQQTATIGFIAFFGPKR